MGPHGPIVVFGIHERQARLSRPTCPPPIPGVFSHVDTWVFDLDNTLYPHTSRVWPQIDERITLYIANLFGLDGLSARALQKYFYHKYGTTLRALIDEYDIDPTTSSISPTISTIRTSS